MYAGTDFTLGSSSGWGKAGANWKLELWKESNHAMSFWLLPDCIDQSLSGCIVPWIHASNLIQSACLYGNLTYGCLYLLCVYTYFNGENLFIYDTLLIHKDNWYS